MRRLFKILSVATLCVMLCGVSVDAGKKAQFVFATNTATKVEGMIQIEKDLNTKAITYHVYIDTRIQAPETYRSVFKYLRQASKKDTFIFYINTYGGNAFTAVALYNEIKKTKAMTIGEIYNAQSAGCMIMMGCKKINANGYALIMMHQWKGGSEGEISDMKNTADAYDRLMKQVIPGIFKGFFTNKEIKYILNGGEVYLVGSEIKTRLRKINKLAKFKK